MHDHTGSITAVAISPDEQTLISGDEYRPLKLWKPNLSLTLKNHLLQVPLEQALLIQALRRRSDRQELLKLTGKAQEHFTQLLPDARAFLRRALNVKY